MTILPNFTDSGFLPPGDYTLSLNEIRESSLVVGTPDLVQTGWDREWRLKLVNNLEILVSQLWKIGVREIFADGSFVEDKAHPNDIDGYFECDRELFITGELTRQLNLLDPSEVWTWDAESRRPYSGYPKKQLPMWHQYRVELYPHIPGLLTGIPDEYGYDQEFPAAFRKSRRDFERRGILKIKYGDDL